MAFSTIAASFAEVALVADVAGLAGVPELAEVVGFVDPAGFAEFAELALADDADVVTGAEADFFDELHPAANRVKAAAQLAIASLFMRGLTR